MAKKQTISRKSIKEGLLNQLEQNGSVEDYYKDLVDDYMALWDAKNLLEKDIKERGVVIEYTSNAGVTNKKKNDSLGELLKVNDRMVKLLDALGITPTQSEGEDDDEM